MANFTKMKLWLLTMLLLVGSVVWGATATITITQNSSGITSSSYNDGAERTWTQNTVGFGAKAVMKQSGQAALQLQSSNGVIYNTSETPGKITSIKVTQTGTARACSVFGYTSRIVNNVAADYTINPSATSMGTTSGTPSTINFTGTNNFFAIKVPSNATYISEIVITYETSSCTSLATPTVTPTAGNTEATLSWGAVANATSYTLIWNGGSPETVTSPVTKTGLTNGTSYSYSVMAVGDGTTYCATNTAATGNVTPVAPSYTITPSSNNESFGTVSLSGSVITGAPLAGYTYASPAYTVLSGTATVSQNGNAFTVTPTSNCAVRINFEAIPTYTVTFDKGTGDCATASLTESIGGAGVTLPTATPPASCVAQNWEFAGWAAASQGESTTSPTLYAAGAIYNPVSNTTLYAVYKVMVSGGITPTSNTITIGGSTTGWTINDRGWSASYWGLANGNTYSILSPTIDLSTITSVNVTVRTYGATSGSSNVLEVLNADGTISYGTYTATSSFVDREFSQISSPFSGSGQLRFISQGSVDGAGLRVTDITINYSVISSTITYNSNPSCSDPIITVSETTLTGFTYAQGSGPSSQQSFTVSGVNLTNNISIAASANYEISKTSGSGYASPLTFTPGEAATPQTVYVRLKSGLAEGNFNDEVINITSTGADAKTVTVSGSVTAPLNPEPSAHVTGFGAVEDGQNAITVNWTDAAGADGYLIKASTTSFEAIAEPVDGTPESNGTLVKNVAQGDEIVEFAGLAAGTTYYFKIWPYSNSGASIDYKTDGSVPEASATTVAPVLPNVIITEVYGGGGNVGATFKNDFIELYNTTESPVDISGWSVQYYSAAGTTASVTVMPMGSVIPAKSHLLILQSGGANGSELFEPNISGTVNMSGTSGKVILFTINTAQTITSDISSVTGNSNFKDYLPYGASTPVWGTAMSATDNATSATRKKVSGEYVYTQNIGNDFEVVTPTPQNSGKYRTTGNGDWNNVATWEFTDNGTWSPATVVPANTTSPVIVNANDELIISTNVSVSSATLAPQGKLTVNSGQTLTVSGNLTLESNAAGTATLVDNGAINVTGTITAQQYLAASRNWYVASPVSNANALGAGFEYWQYNEPDGSSATENWTVVSASTPLVPGRGYVVKPSGETTYAFSTTTGTLNTGNVTVPLTRTVGVTKEGFNLVGNPYPSYLNLNDLLTGDIETSYWMRGRNSDNTAWVFDSFNKEGNVGTNNSGKAVTTYVPPMQSFWVRVKTGVASTNLVFDNTMRAHIDEPTNRFRAPQNTPLIRLEMSNGTAADQTVLYANNNAVDAVDKYDTHKMLNNSTFVPDIYSMVGNQKLAINGLSTLPLNVEMPLGILVKEAGNFSIRASEMRAIDADIVLIDKLNGNAEWLLNGGTAYQFASSATTHAERFALVLRAPGTTTGECCNDILAAQTMVFVDAFRNINISCAMAVNKNAKVAVYNSVGQMLTQRNLENGSASIAVTSKGVYLVELNVDGLRTTKRVIVK